VEERFFAPLQPIKKCLQNVFNGIHYVIHYVYERCTLCVHYVYIMYFLRC